LLSISLTTRSALRRSVVALPDQDTGVLTYNETLRNIEERNPAEPLRETYPELYDFARRICMRLNPAIIDDPTFKSHKYSWHLIRDILSKEDDPARKLGSIREVLAVGESHQATSRKKEGWRQRLKMWFTGSGGESELTDPDFVQALRPPLSDEPEILDLIGRIDSSIQSYLQTLSATHVEDAIKQEKAGLLGICRQRLEKRTDEESRRAALDLHRQLVAEMPSATS
jgi:hypothetical protein